MIAMNGIHQRHREESEALRSKHECTCSDTCITKRQLADGRLTAWLTCSDCGRAIRSVRKSEYDMDALPWFDESKRQQTWEARNAEYEALRQRHQEEWQCVQDQEKHLSVIEGRQWWIEYNRYLRSPQWHSLRKKVLERDGGICQACLSREATQVHHLFYDLYNQLGQSAAFECVAICYQCHVKIHPHMAEAQHQIVVSGYNPYLNGAYNGR